MTTDNPTTKKSRLQKATDYLQGKGKLELLTGLIGAKQLEATQREQARNQEAESAWARRELWGDSGQAEADEMGNTILGDVQYPTPIVMQGNQSSLGSLATIAIAGLLGGGGLAAGLAAPYLLDKLTPDEQPTPVVEPGTDETVSIGFGKVDGGIAEYLKANP